MTNGSRLVLDLRISTTAMLSDRTRMFLEAHLGPHMAVDMMIGTSSLVAILTSLHFLDQVHWNHSLPVVPPHLPDVSV